MILDFTTWLLNVWTNDRMQGGWEDFIESVMHAILTPNSTEEEFPFVLQVL